MLALAWWTGDQIGAVHEYLGYTAGALLLARLAWGYAGRGHARFASFVVGWQRTRTYARDLMAGRHVRHLGHNPLGGWMIVWLLSCVAALVITGWLYTTDWLWGYGWLANLHAGLGWVLLASVVVHVLGVIVTSVNQRENLVAAMFTGHKRPPAGDDVA